MIDTKEMLFHAIKNPPKLFRTLHWVDKINIPHEKLLITNAFI